MNFKYVIMISISLILLSCKKDKLKDDKGVLIGKWSWTYTSHGFGWCEQSGPYQIKEAYHEIITPESLNKSYSVEFLKKGKILFYEDGVLKETDRMVFDYFDNDGLGNVDFYIYLNNKKDRGMGGSIHDDTLHFDYPLKEIEPDCENYLNFLVRE